MLTATASVEEWSRPQSGTATDVDWRGSTTLHTLVSHAKTPPRTVAAAAGRALLLLAAGAAAA
jgi:hypothetical protein